MEQEQIETEARQTEGADGRSEEERQEGGRGSTQAQRTEEGTRRRDVEVRTCMTLFRTEFVVTSIGAHISVFSLVSLSSSLIWPAHITLLHLPLSVVITVDRVEPVPQSARETLQHLCWSALSHIPVALASPHSSVLSHVVSRSCSCSDCRILCSVSRVISPRLECGPTRCCQRRTPTSADTDR